MSHSEATHRLLILGIAASVSFTIYVAGLLFGEVNALNQNVDKLLEDVGYIKGVISKWETYPP